MNLPFEVLQNIFSNLLETSYLIECQATCKNWSEPAQNILYRDLQLLSIEQLILYISTITTSTNNLGRKAKKLTFGNIPSKAIIPFLRILGIFCPNVESFVSFTSHKRFYQGLFNEVLNGNFQFVTSVQPPDDSYQLLAYNALALVLRDNLKEFVLCDSVDMDDDVTPEIRLEYENLADRLHEFKSLNSLSIIKHTLKSIRMFDEIIDKCPLLNTLGFVTYANLVDSMGGMFELANDADDYDAPINLSLILPRPNIREFRGNFVLFSDQTVLYFMRKFPNLNTLTINTEVAKVIPEEIMETRLSEDIMVRFFKYALRIPHVNIDYIYMENVYDFLVMFLEHVNFRGTLKIMYQLCSDDDIGDTWWSERHPRIQIKKDNNSCVAPSITLIYPKFATEYSDEEDDDEDESIENIETLPHQELILRAGNKIRELYIHNLDITGPYSFVYSRDKLYKKLAIESYLAYVFSHCTLLHTLTLDHSNFGSMTPLKPPATKNMSIKKLVIRGDIPPEVEFLTSLSTLLPSLKYMDIECCEMAQVMAPSSAVGQALFIINMPYTSFKLINFRGRNLSEYTKFNLKVVSSTNGVYFFTSNQTMTAVSNCSVRTYADLLQHKSTFSIHIQCKSIKQFKFSVNGNEGEFCFSSRSSNGVKNI